MATDKARLVWTVVLAVEMLAVLIGNTISIVVFWKRRSSLKQTYYLLINLSVADFLVGIGEIKTLVDNILYVTHSKPVIGNKYFTLDVYSGLASLAFLTLISMERLYAIAWPFHHRAKTTRAYIYFIVATWSLPAVIAAIFNCGVATKIISTKIAALIGASFLALCLLLILCSYLAIWKFKRKEDARIPIDRHEANKKLAMTLFIISILSVITWLPLTVS